MPHDRNHNNSLDAYSRAAEGASSPDAQLRMNENGDIVEKTRQDKFQAFVGGDSRNSTNKAVLMDFKAVLAATYGAEAADIAFQSTGLEAKLNEGRPLTAHRVPDAIRQGETASILLKDAAHKQMIAERDQRAAQWQPQAGPSNLQAAQQPGLRCNHSDQGGMRLQAWHLKNNHDEGIFELDNAVRAEMAAMAHPPEDARLCNLQARLNLLEKMVGEARQNLLGPPEQTDAQSAAINVVTAPEWLFCGLEGEYGGDAVSGGALTESEMRKVTEAVTAMSGRNPGILIMPGTILWSKPVDPVPTHSGQPRPMDMVFNSAPVVANGRLEHITNKLHEGMDLRMAAKGLPNQVVDGGAAYDAPDVGNDFGARLQVFRGDSHHSDIEVDAALQEIEAIAAPGRAIPQWEADLRQGVAPGANWQSGFANTATIQTNNNLFEFQDRTFALDVCVDHSPMTKAAKNEALDINGDPLRTRIALENGVDAHLVISSGSDLSPASNYVKNGGAYGGNDLNEGVAQFIQITHVPGVVPGSIARPAPRDGRVRFEPPPPPIIAVPPVGGGAPGVMPHPAVPPLAMPGIDADPNPLLMIAEENDIPIHVEADDLGDEDPSESLSTDDETEEEEQEETVDVRTSAGIHSSTSSSSPKVSPRLPFS